MVVREEFSESFCLVTRRRVVHDRVVPIRESLLNLRKHFCLQYSQILILLRMVTGTLIADDRSHHDAERELAYLSHILHIFLCAVDSDTVGLETGFWNCLLPSQKTFCFHKMDVTNTNCAILQFNSHKNMAQ